MKRSALIVFALCLTASSVFAQGDISDGDVTFGYNDFVGVPGLADLEVDLGTDHLFQQTWFYRIDGDTRETILPPPDSESYVGSVATLTWNDVDGRGFSAVEVSTVSDTGATAGGVRHDLTITNDTAGDLTITVFNYTDLDLDTTFADDSAIDLTATNLGVMETSIANYRGLGADAFKVTEFQDLLLELGDDLVTDLDNSGTPFGPADFTGAFQWNLTTIPAGASASFTAVQNVNDSAAPLELAFAGSCPGAVEVRIAGATPSGTVVFAGASTYGSFTVPGGGCAGTELGLDSPSVLGTRTADGSGEVTLNLTLPSGACGQIAQAVDSSTCSATNTDPLP